GLGVAWARVFLGVHFPDDMAASALVAIACGCLAGVAQPVVRLRVLPVVEGAYETSLRLLRLPPALIPRRTDQPKS
ncbi:MAG TPA: phosphatase PAP2 family protein, partial [Acetobacteraceae bacterium]|nr:phosphatase PAP2 family protein [Acetobacteraceae bacterium]